MKNIKIIILCFMTISFAPVFADKIGVGDWHTVVVTTDGNAWTFGSGWALGNGTHENQLLPTEVMGDVEKVAAGGSTTLFLKKDGRLYGCGGNSHGCLGLGNEDKQPSPQLITSDVVSMATGGSWILVLKSDGSLWTSGSNGRGELGDGTLDSRSVLRKVVDSDVVQVVTGWNCSFIIKKDGSLWACGNNEFGQLGDGTKDMSSTFIKITDNVKKVSGGHQHTLILKKDGSLWGCGDNNFGDLGKADYFNTTTPIFMMNDVDDMAAGQWNSMVVKKDGTLWAAGWNETGMLGDGTTTDIENFKKVTDNVSNVYTSHDAFHAIILKKDGSIWSCGSNYDGTLGNGAEGNQLFPLEIMPSVTSVSTNLHHSMVLKVDGSLWTFGLNDHGQLGNGTLTSSSTPISITRGVKQISSGFYHSMFVKNDGSLWGCGSNEYGQLGDGTTEDKLSPKKIMDDVEQVSAGGHHTMILKTDGTLWACGYNYDGRLGNGKFYDGATSRPEKIMEDVASVDAGGWHTLIIKKDGSLWACGDNGGTLGDGTGKNQANPVKIMDNVAQVSAGRYHSLIVQKDGTLWACGSNDFGQLGNSNTDKNEYKPIKVMEDVAQVSAAAHHSMVLKTDGTLWTFGRNDHGELGIGVQFYGGSTPTKIMDNISQISAGGSKQDSHSMMVTKDHVLYACGNRTYGQLGDGRSEVFPSQIMTNVKFINASINKVDYTLDDEDKIGQVKAILDKGSVKIPSELSYHSENYNITQIGDSIFKGKTESNISNTVVFPKSIISTSSKAFDVYGSHSMIWESDCKLTDDMFTNKSYHDGNFLLYVSDKDIAPSNVNNVIVNGVAKNEIVLKGNHPFFCPTDFSAGQISYSHNFTMETGLDDCAGWESIALPFDVKNITHETAGEITPFGNSNSQGKKFWLYSLSSKGFIEASSIKANTPYIISMPNNSYYGKKYNIPGKVTFSATNTVVKSSNTTDLNTSKYEGGTFKPNYSRPERSVTSYLLNVTNDYTTFYGSEKPGSIFINNNREAYPFEGILSIDDTALLSPYYNITFADGGVTGITKTAFGDNTKVWRTLDGRKLQLEPVQKGIYIVNGRKVIIK